MNDSIKPLSIDQLRRKCDPGKFNFSSTADLPPLEVVVGQERAVKAVSFGIDIESPGYHMYALGPAGTGKSTTIRRAPPATASSGLPHGGVGTGPNEYVRIRPSEITGPSSQSLAAIRRRSSELSGSPIANTIAAALRRQFRIGRQHRRDSGQGCFSKRDDAADPISAINGSSVQTTAALRAASGQ